MKKIDLHTHTTASDGIYSPRQLVDLAVRSGVVAMAVTDHDTVDGLPEAAEYAASLGFKLYPGVEFSIDYDAGSFHLLGLNIDYTNERLRKTVRELAEHRATRAYRIIDDLKKSGIDLPIEEVLREAGDGSMGRPHVARVMVNHGYAPNIREIFQHYLVKGKPGYVKKVRIRFEDAVDLIRECGGIAVVAHPVSLECGSMDEFEELLEGFVRKGVEGLEAFASMHTVEQAALYSEIAMKHNLLQTGGSDFHGDKDETIGHYRKENPIPIELYDMLESFIRKKALQRG
jgi:3',5'-nucleoside bisphosphate phosphatase